MMRPSLGDFSSIVCFKALITGVEDTLGPEGAAATFTQAGRLRGKTLASSLGVAGSKVPAAELAALLDGAVGAAGTKLCAVTAVRQEGDDLIVDTAETVCSAGEPAGSSRRCTFTMGAVWGAIEAIYARSFSVRQTESVLNGGASDSFRFSPA